MQIWATISSDTLLVDLGFIFTIYSPGSRFKSYYLLSPIEFPPDYYSSGILSGLTIT